MDRVSKSLEDYLEAIVMLGGDVDSPVRAVDIAEKLGVSKAAVSRAVSSLKEKGYLNQPYYGDITLTEKGSVYGKSVLNKHDTLTAFLRDQVGIDERTAEEEACIMEHAISDESFEKWVTFIEGLSS